MLGREMEGSARSQTQTHPIQVVVDHLRVPAALIDEGGRVRAHNRAWGDLCSSGGLLAGASFGIDADFIGHCTARRREEPRLLASVRDAMHAVLDGRAEELSVVYASIPGEIGRDGSVLQADAFVLRFTRVAGELGAGLLVTHRPKLPDLNADGHETSTQRTIDLELANERLREEQRRQRGILDSIRDIAWLKDERGRFLAVNRKFAEAAGVDPESLVGTTDFDIWSEELAARYRADDQRVMATRTIQRFEEPFVDRAGRRSIIETVKVPILNDDGVVIGTAGLARDISERRASEEVLRRSHADLEALVAQRTEELRSDIEARKRAEEERTRLEQELLQSQKLEGVGRLAGGIAHDFNNLLTIILAYGHQTLTKVELPTQGRAYVTEMVTAAQRASELTRQLLAFARKQPIEPRVIDLNELVLSTDGLLRPLLGSDIEVVTLPCSETCPVKVDPGQFERILLNLAANARDAMPGGGKLVIATSTLDLSESSGFLPADLPPGAYVRLAVSDTGTGIPREILGDIFDPFFTTKAVGNGTGLGLATCYGIVKQAGGHITVESDPGEGTSFEIYLPRTEMERPRPRPTTQPPRSAGHETILLIEDEPLLRSITSEVLNEEGYRVLTAESGPEAIRLSEAHEGPIHLVLTDVVMPHMNGKVAAAKILEARPDARVIFMSGYTGAMGGQPEKLDEGTSFLGKPFTREALLDRVRQILDPPALLL